MQEASFNGLLKAIFWIFAFYYIFKFLARLFLPVIVKKVAQKAEEQFRQQHQNYQGQQSAPNFKSDTRGAAERSGAKPRETKKVGEYIDYEEVE